MKPRSVVIAFALFVIITLGISASSPALAARQPLVLAFYYAWFDENSWTPNHVADMPAARYTSRDPQAIARQIQQARGAGIDAFVVSWWGQGNPTDSNFKLMLEQAQAANFRAAVDFEVNGPFYKSRDQMVTSLKTLLATHAQHPAYLRVDGKPVIFFWRQQNYSAAVWQQIRDQVDPGHQSLWIAEGVDTSYLRVFDGHHLYSVAWSKNVAADFLKYATRVRAAGADKIWVATTMPGVDDRLVRPKQPTVRPRENGDFYRETWRGAFSTTPDWVIINSWNEWVESSMIEPSVTYGNLYLDITREFTAQFHAGLPPPTARPTATRAPAKTPSPTPTLIPGGVRGQTTDILRVRAEPSTDAGILGRLREGASLTILARDKENTWWQIAYPDAKRRGWVSAEFATADGDTASLPIVGSPDESETLTFPSFEHKLEE